MTRKDYERIAGVFREATNQIEEGKDNPAVDSYRLWAVTRALASMMATSLAEDNERFNRDRFLTACGF